ncbi:single-stranded DNA-binding protein [Crenobacter sp. SG2305]|uniref:single-stranded DNA-binding protein n=1 Tax=Crenobacter oryzisoli TaxID=3056844 RepID=UPI0025AADE16|nr:single-stranded DNA-binding protein [Crenobacter sp. SG2305]MDN0082510.1 single-stranded DNA-binding protein [Crenobacter sp. SG2305]
MSVNKVILVGNLGKDPEVRSLPNGEQVANFSIATSENWKGKDGQRQERTEWHNIVMYRRLAEIAGQYLKKGRTVYIEGRIQSRKYTGKDGVERIAYEIVADQMQMVGGRDGNSGGDSGDRSPGNRSDYSNSQSHSEPPAAPRRMEPKSPAKFDDYADDIPF